MSQLPDFDELADRQWQDWQVSATVQGLSFSFAADFVTALKQVWEASDYVGQACRRDPAMLVRLVEDGWLMAAAHEDELAQRLAQRLTKVANEAALAAELRAFRREQMVRIIWRDLAGWGDLAQTMAELSDLADACVAQALDRLYTWALEEMGIPRDHQGVQQSLVVLGMGKLGAKELNLSSDIDLIFAYPAAGEVEGGRYLTNEQFFIRLGQRLVQVLNAQTVDGFVFRVDTRLRPFGDAGPLVMSFNAMEDYYHSQAREWERYAMVKARPVAGDAVAGAQLMEMLRPFVYRRYLDFGAIESLRDMKQLISRELRRSGMTENIKLGPGGIREIEFIGQAFQLIRGGRDPELQIRPILAVLSVLQQKSLLPEFVVTELTGAYEFLRRVENRLQAWQDRQIHSLPKDPVSRTRLARAMGYTDWPSFYAELDQHRRRVQQHFDQVFANPQAEDGPAEHGLATLWRDEPDAKQALAVLEKGGFAAPEQALEKLQQFRDSTARKGLSSRGRERLDRLMPLLLQAVAAADTRDLALPRLLKLLESVVRRSAYIALLLENPIALSQLVRLTGGSPWIAQLLAHHPVLLDQLLDTRQLYAPPRRSELEAEIRSLMAPLDDEDLEQQMERLRQFAQSNMLRVAAADLTGVIPLMVVSDYLSEIAEVAVASVLDQTWRHFVQRHGKPTQILGGGRGFLVIAYGKLGGLEMGYGSDMDLVFLHGSESINAMTDGERPLSNMVFFARLGQRIIHMLTTHTPSGVLYEVDTRLRPDGQKGMLVRSLSSFADYQRKEAWTWEHQALVRARPIAGEPAVVEAFLAIRREILCRQRTPSKLCEEVRAMREKMREQLDRTSSDRFDLKQGVGGIADIEFMVQYNVLRWAGQYPDLTEWSDNIRLLETLARHELLPNGVAETMIHAYKALRAAYHRSSLQEQPTLVAQDCLSNERAQIAAFWQQLMES